MDFSRLAVITRENFAEAGGEEAFLEINLGQASHKITPKSMGI
jgi:hypothetical protein